MSVIPLGSGPEFDRIRAIARRLGAHAAELGDDCALIQLGDTTLALSTDVSVEGVHFRREWLSPQEIGWRATSAALSDLAGMGASALGVLAALTVPPVEKPAMFAALMEGVGAAAAAAGGKVLGGDLSRGEALSLAITVVGTAGRPVERRGAQVGDRLWVTGELGGARAALEAWRAGRIPAPGARERFAKPVPRLDLGLWLAGHGATAMLDLSDGIAGDVGHLAAASKVALVVDVGALPVHTDVLREAFAAGETPGVFAARGGEDYELLVAMPRAFTGTDELPLSCIGDVHPGSGVAFFEDGFELRLSGYDHFA
jgi:thiamine-monophosphate kinase